MISYGILLVGTAFYFLTITSLISIIRDENITKSFLRLMDDDDNGIISKRQIRQFTQCEKYDPKKILKKVTGSKIDLNDLAYELSPKIVMNIIVPCVDTTEQISHPDSIKNLKKKQLKQKILDAYDINNDKIVQWTQFHLANQIINKNPKYNLRDVFAFFDRNLNWKIQVRELDRIKPANIELYLTTGKRR